MTRKKHTIVVNDAVSFDDAVWQTETFFTTKDYNAWLENTINNIEQIMGELHFPVPAFIKFLKQVKIVRKRASAETSNVFRVKTKLSKDNIKSIFRRTADALDLLYEIYENKGGTAEVYLVGDLCNMYHHLIDNIEIV